MVNTLKIAKNKFSPAPSDVSPAPDLVNPLGALASCHWSGQMLRLIRDGVVRPGAMRHQLPGLNQKVQTACLTKMTRYGLMTRTVFAEAPPRVEYALTPLGLEYASLLDTLAVLEKRVVAGLSGG